MTEVVVMGGERLTAGMRRWGRLDAAAHTAVHGVMPRYSLAKLIALAERVDLRGHGGAAFPFARKLRAVADSAKRRDLRPAVLVNGAEGEPASVKDALLLTRAPHLVLAGATLAATALGADTVVVAVTEPTDVPADPGDTGDPADDRARSVRRALAEGGIAGGSEVVTLPEAFVTGEGGALVQGVNGGPAIPPGQKVRAATSGVDGLPTLLSNTETFAQLGLLGIHGAAWYADVGIPDEPGTVLLSVTTRGRAPVVVETPTGVPLTEVLRACGADSGQGVLTGGYHGTWLTPAAADAVRVSRAGMDTLGGALGAGIIVVVPPDVCPLGEIARVAAYLGAQSSGQCGPCYMGLPALARAVAALASGAADSGTLTGIRRGAEALPGRGACHHPDGATRFLRTALDVFHEDVSAHLSRGGCGRPTRGVLPLPGEDTAGSGARLTVDWTRCDGHGLCAHLVPGLIRLDQDGFPIVSDTPIPAGMTRDVASAIAMCPALALRVEERTG